MKTAIMIILILLCAALANALRVLERGLRRAREQIKAQMEGESTARLALPCPNAAAEELFQTVNELLELRQAEGAAYRRREQELRRQIADVSHDLRTPLTSVLGYLQLLETEELSPERRREYLAIIRGRADTLQTLITSFYDLSRVEGGQWKLEREPVDLTRIVGDQLASAYETLEDMGMELEAEIAEDLPPVWGDRQAAVRIVSNLLNNAWKHGTGRLTVKLFREGNCVVSQFANKAPDMSPEDAAQVFERFYTANRARDRQNTGLGLAIVKALGERMGCQVSAALAEGVFTVRVVWQTASGLGMGSSC